MLSLIML